MTRAPMVVDLAPSASFASSGSSGLRRVSALLIDYFVVAIWLGITFFIAFLVTRGKLEIAGMTSPGSRQLLAAITLIMPVLAYFAIAEASPWQGTIGKRATGLQVTDAGLRRIGLGRSLLRSTLKLLPWELGDTFVHQIPKDGEIPGSAWAFLVAAGALALAYVLGLFLPGRRPLYDRIAGTRVVPLR